jgi:hypothetical protein
MGYQECSTHGLRYEDYGECSQCITERIQEDAMRRQEDLLREQVRIMREQSAQQASTPSPESAGSQITADNMSIALLTSILDNAAVDYKLDSDGDIVVLERLKFFVFPSAAKNRLRLVAMFGLRDDSTEMERLSAANSINTEYIVIRASVSENVLNIDYDLLVNDGLTRRDFLRTLKHFSAVTVEAVTEYGSAVIG